MWTDGVEAVASDGLAQTSFEHLICMSFLLKQRHAPFYGLRDIIDVGDINHILFNGETYEYIYYITSLILEKAVETLRIYRCDDGSLQNDDSELWKVINSSDRIQGGCHVFECTDGNFMMPFKLIEGMITEINIDPVIWSSAGGMDSADSGGSSADRKTLTALRSRPSLAHRNQLNFVCVTSSKRT